MSDVNSIEYLGVVPPVNTIEELQLDTYLRRAMQGMCTLHRLGLEDPTDQGGSSSENWDNVVFAKRDMATSKLRGSEAYVFTAGEAPVTLADSRRARAELTESAVTYCEERGIQPSGPWAYLGHVSVNDIQTLRNALTPQPE